MLKISQSTEYWQESLMIGKEHIDPYKALWAKEMMGKEEESKWD